VPRAFHPCGGRYGCVSDASWYNGGMTISSLSLQNFRSYSKKTFTFSPETTLILGPNASGKTNILEAIMMLAMGKSFRADREPEVIQWNTDVSRITGHVSQEGNQNALEIIVTHGDVQGRRVPTKKCLVNGVVRRQIDFVGNLRAVLFWPEDLLLITDSPSLRRRYLDSVLVQVDREYRRSLLSYERGLRQRNRLLSLIGEGKASRGQLLFWDQLLVKAGGYITEKRGELLDFYNNFNEDKWHTSYRVSYDKSIISESRLAQYAEEEVAAGATLVGPHRDDFKVYTSYSDIKNYKELSQYGSRGEQRLATLWMKLAEFAYAKNITGDQPVLLLDDIFSELDPPHRKVVLDLVGKQQTIVTSADPAILEEVGLPRVSVITL